VQPPEFCRASTRVLTSRSIRGRNHRSHGPPSRRRPMPRWWPQVRFGDHRRPPHRCLTTRRSDLQGMPRDRSLLSRRRAREYEVGNRRALIAPSDRSCRRPLASALWQSARPVSAPADASTVAEDVGSAVRARRRMQSPAAASPRRRVGRARPRPAAPTGGLRLVGRRTSEVQAHGAVNPGARRAQ